jgi:acetyl-CoA acetyltransferase
VKRAVIAGIGRTAYSRKSGRSTLGMAVEACRSALDDAGLPVAEVDGIVTFIALNDSATGEEVAYGLGIEALGYAANLLGGGNVVTATVANAMMAIESDAAKNVLVFRSLNSRSGHRFGRIDGDVEIGGDSQYGAPHGYVVPGQWFAMYAQRYLHETGCTVEDLGQVAVTTRAHAVPNPHALLREPMTLDQYLASRWINEPFRLFDCAVETDGAVALLVTDRDRARSLAKPAIAMRGHAFHTGAGGHTDQWSDMTRLYSVHVAPRLWEATGVGPGDVDLACLYDCFTYTTLATFEDYGFCERGQGGRTFAEGGATYGGGVVVNPHGGLLSEGYIHGLNHHYEAVLQLRGEAGERQVADAELALVTAGTGPYGGALVYERV